MDAIGQTHTTAAAAADHQSPASWSEQPDIASSSNPAIVLLFALAREPTAELGDNNLRERILAVKQGGDGTDARDSKRGARKRDGGAIPPAARVSERAEGRRKPTRKRKTMKRCTSPSHFALSAEEELKYGADYTLDLPSRERVDQLLRHVAAFYYKPKELHPNGINVWVDNEYDQSVYPTLDLLLSPLRRPSPRENWSNREVAIFEAALCKIGKRFGEIARMIKSKTTNQVVAFYYTFWKKHEHYRAWKGQRNEQQQEVKASSAGTQQQQPQQQSRAASSRGTSDAAAARSAAAGTTIPASAAAASSSPAAPSIPASLVSSRVDNSHPRIRMVDQATGQEHFFILPIVGDEVALRVLQRSIEADERETEKLLQQQQRRAREQEEAQMEDEQQQEAEAATTPTTERTKRTAAARPPRPTSARAASPSAAAAPAAPLPGFRCILPALGDPSRVCNKFFTSTNSLGSHLFMTHKLTKATAGGIEKGYYIQCVK